MPPKANKKEDKQDTSPDQTCGVCKEKIIENPKTYEEQSTECECCLRWFHLNCVKLAKEKFEAISKFNLHWYCDSCDQGAVTLHQHCSSLRAENISIKKDILSLTERVKKCERVDSTLTDKLKKIEQSVKAKVTEETGQLKSELSSQFNKQIDMKVISEVNKSRANNDSKITSESAKLREEFNLRINDVIQRAKEDIKNELTAITANENNSYANVAQTVREIVEEMQERAPAPTREMVREEMQERERKQLKKNNLVILNLKEAERGHEEEDIERINDLISTRLNLQITITNATRMGTFNREKKRPIRVILERIEDKKSILSRAASLRDLEEDDEFNKVYIRPDLTKIEIEASKNLYAELLKRRSDYPESRWKITKGEIVEVVELE